MKERFEIVLEPMSGTYNSPHIRRLALIMKRLGRNFGYRVISAREVSGAKPICRCCICVENAQDAQTTGPLANQGDRCAINNPGAIAAWFGGPPPPRHVDTFEFR